MKEEYKIYKYNKEIKNDKIKMYRIQSFTKRKLSIFSQKRLKMYILL